MLMKMASSQMGYVDIVPTVYAYGRKVTFRGVKLYPDTQRHETGKKKKDIIKKL